MTESVDTKPSILQPFYDHARLMDERDQARMCSLESKRGPLRALAGAIRAAIYGWRR